MNCFRVVGSRTVAFSALSLVVGGPGTQAMAQDDEDESVEKIVVEGSLGSLPTRNVGSVFGFDENLLETPRSASTVSSE